MPCRKETRSGPVTSRCSRFDKLAQAAPAVAAWYSASLVIAATIRACIRARRDHHNRPCRGSPRPARRRGPQWPQSSGPPGDDARLRRRRGGALGVPVDGAARAQPRGRAGLQPQRDHQLRSSVELALRRGGALAPRRAGGRPRHRLRRDGVRPGAAAGGAAAQGCAGDRPGRGAAGVGRAGGALVRHLRGGELQRGRALPHLPGHLRADARLLRRQRALAGRAGAQPRGADACAPGAALAVGRQLWRGALPGAPDGQADPAAGARGEPGAGGAVLRDAAQAGGAHHRLRARAVGGGHHARRLALPGAPPGGAGGGAGEAGGVHRHSLPALRGAGADARRAEARGAGGLVLHRVALLPARRRVQPEREAVVGRRHSLPGGEGADLPGEHAEVPPDARWRSSRRSAT